MILPNLVGQIHYTESPAYCQSKQPAPAAA